MFGERFVEGTQDKIILEQLDAKEFEEFLLAIHQTQKEIKRMFPGHLLKIRHLQFGMKFSFANMRRTQTLAINDAKIDFSEEVYCLSPNFQ